MIAAFSDGLVASLSVELTRYEREQNARAPTRMSALLFHRAQQLLVNSTEGSIRHDRDDIA